jgi:hypothetical protein
MDERSNLPLNKRDKLIASGLIPSLSKAQSQILFSSSTAINDEHLQKHVIANLDFKK